MKTRQQIQLEANRKWVATNPAKVLYNGCRSNAKRRGLEFTISFDDVQALLRPMTCSATGLKLTWNGTEETRRPWAPSLDRMDSSLGYVSGNVRIVCWMFNRCKGEGSDADVLRMAEALMLANGPST